MVKCYAEPMVNWMAETNKFTCEACGGSFSTHEELENHFANAHGGAVGAQGTQLRQSEEIQKQRAEE
jgi:hypothetical protein